MKNPRNTSKEKPKGNEYMGDKAFADLKGALEDALAFERCERSNLKVTRIQVVSQRRRRREFQLLSDE
jgi:hypothetical protein